MIAIKNLIEDKHNGRFIEFNKKNSLVLWQSLNNNEYVVHKVYTYTDRLVLENGNYFPENNSADAMLAFVSRQNKKISIEVEFSEEDLEDLKSPDCSFDWTYESNSNISVDVKISRS